MNVDAAFVVEEVLIYSERSFDRSVLKDVSLNRLLVDTKLISLGSLVDILTVGFAIGGVSITGFNAGWSFDFSSYARRVDVRCYVMSAWRERVSLAPVGSSVKITCNETSVNVVVHSLMRVTTITTKPTAITTIKEVFSRETDVFSELYAMSVGQRLSSSESPAGTTVRLVSDFPKRRTVEAPFSARVERIRNVIVDFVDDLEMESMTVIEESAAVSLSAFEISINEFLVNTCFPGSVRSVNFLSETSKILVVLLLVMLEACEGHVTGERCQQEARKNQKGCFLHLFLFLFFWKWIFSAINKLHPFLLFHQNLLLLFTFYILSMLSSPLEFPCRPIDGWIDQARFRSIDPIVSNRFSLVANPSVTSCW